MDPGPFFYTVITVYHLFALFIFLQTITFYHLIRLILCLQQTGEIDNLTLSWDKVLGCVVCRFPVAAGAKQRPGRGATYKLSGTIVKLASINLWKLVLSPAGSINLDFILREDLLLCSSYLPLGVPNWESLAFTRPRYLLATESMQDHKQHRDDKSINQLDKVLNIHRIPTNTTCKITQR
jgi:hypothetical protein